MVDTARRDPAAERRSSSPPQSSCLVSVSYPRGRVRPCPVIRANRNLRQSFYSENFENGVGRTPIPLTSYTGAPPLLKKYTAANAFLKNCNGDIVEFESNERTKAADCEEVAFNRVRQMAWVLGKLRGMDPTANHAVTAYTDGGGTLPTNSVQFETVTPISLLASTRFITFSVDAAETNCKHSHAEFKFYLLGGSLETPTFTTPIDPCTDKNSKTFEPPTLGTKPSESFKAGSFAGNAATLFNGSELGIRMRNGQTSEDGNDASFDNVEVLDASPQLDRSFSPEVLNVGAPSQLTFTITNTSELAAKNDNSRARSEVHARRNGARRTCDAHDRCAYRKLGNRRIREHSDSI